MVKYVFSREDIRQIKERGLSEETVNHQLSLFDRGVASPELVAPCTQERGVLVLSDKERRRLAALAEPVVQQGRITKFVPASGAATRMFRSLLALYNSPDALDRTSIDRQSGQHNKEYAALVSFMDNIEKFAFHEALSAAMAAAGKECRALVAAGRYRPVLRHLLTTAGLGYAGLPKGMILFHRYSDNNGPACAYTAFEEHLAEAVELATDRNGVCRLHFTVPGAHRDSVASLLKQTCDVWRQADGIRPDISFSTQHPFTDTIAADHANMPFRDENGRLVFRPGGHGALLDNLNDLNSDIVFIKNIDNISVAGIRQKTATETRALFGLLVELQQQVFACMDQLAADTCPDETVDQALDFACSRLNLCLPETFSSAGKKQQKAFLLTLLDRPIRVCGVVKNVGEPGGGPFFVRTKDGVLSAQIIEAAQVNGTDPDQQAIWQSATHFNPVFIVCGLRDAKGQPYDLKRFVDPDMGIITEKSTNGRPLRALEHPGLWNGSMAFWNTVFVEISPLAFNPVKTVFDLLRKGHQPEGGL